MTDTKAMKTEKPKNIAVIGTGYWGKHLVRNLYRLEHLQVVCDVNENLLNEFKTQYPRLETCTTWTDVIQDNDIDGVVIATPAETHYELVREALRGGKHVFVEKPLALRSDDAVELNEIAKTNRLILMVGHLLQYHPVFLKIKDLVKQGTLGRINYIYSNRLNLGKIRREENILWSFAPHDISMILTLAGEDPQSVMATGGNYLHNEIADVTTTHLEFSSGMKAHIFVSWLHPFKEQKLVVVGENKMAVFDDTQPWPEKLLIYPHLIEWQNNIPVPLKAEPERFDIPEAEPLELECKHFIDSIQNGVDPITCGEEGLRVLKVLNACQESMDNNGKNITLQQRSGLDQGKDFFTHYTALVDDNVRIGKGSKIWCFSHILPNTKIGINCTIGQNVAVGPDVEVGDNCKIQNNVSIYKGVILESGVFCGPSMVFTNVYNPRAMISRMDQVKPTLVREGATIGANATIVCGITLGRYCFIGAGSVVNRDTPDYALMVGNPAKQIGWVCLCGERLPDDLTCRSCGSAYEKAGEGIRRGIDRENGEE